MPTVPTVSLESPEATSYLAQTLAPRLRAGDALLLAGEIGAGKSHFARALIAARLDATGQQEDIPSPTYTLVQTYQAGDLAVWHCDLYRLSEPDEAVELGLLEAFDSALCLVEWPERMGDLAPASAAHLRFAPGAGADQRVLEITGGSDRLAHILQDAVSAFRAAEPAL